MSQKTPWNFDVRIRERILRKGLLDEKDIEKYLKELPDMSAQADNVTIPQPAVGNGSPATTPPPASPSPPSPSND